MARSGTGTSRVAPALGATLIIAPNWVGDAVMAEPLIARLSQRFPGQAVDVLGPSYVLPVFTRMAGVRNTLALPTEFGHGGGLQWWARRRFAQALIGQYQRAIVLPNSIKSALIPWFAKIPERIGFVGEQRYRLLNDARPLDVAALPLMVERFAALGEPRGSLPSRPVPAPKLQAGANGRAVASALGLSFNRPIIGFCPGAEFGPAKRWPHEQFAALALKLCQAGQQVWLLGSPKDAPVGVAIMLQVQALSGASDDAAAVAHHQVVNLIGRTSLTDVFDLLSLCAGVVTNDSGLMHAACAVSPPEPAPIAVVALFGSSSPQFTPPLAKSAEVISLQLACSPCFARECPLGHFKCMQDITPEAVFAKVSAKLF